MFAETGLRGRAGRGLGRSGTATPGAAERAYLGLLALGVVLPYRAAAPWLLEHGPDVPRLMREAFATPVSGFFGWDVVVSASALLALAAVDEELPVRQRLAVAGGSLGGASVGLPMYLYLRERHRRCSSDPA